MNYEINSTLGHEIRRNAKAAEFIMRSSGTYGLLSFVLSYVEEGEGCDFFIENYAVDICGEDVRTQVYDAVKQGMNRYWVRPDGFLELLQRRQPAPGTGPKHGFSILKAAQDLKRRFDEAGRAGQVSFAQACIASGLRHPTEIIDEACAISGDHLEAVFDTLLMEGENIHWRKCADGSLQLING